MSETKRRRRSGFRGHSIKLRDVAAKSGVSPATVSRVLNNPALVSKETLELVRLAIDDLGYMVNPAGRALASNSLQTIGVVVPSLSNPIFASGVEGMEQTLNELGYSLIVSSSNYDLEREEAQARILIARGASALMLMGALHTPGLLKLLRSRTIPFVNTWVYESAAQDPCVGFDNAEAIVPMVRYLLELGHRNFGVISGKTTDNDRAAGRLKGIRQTLGEFGLDLPPDRVREHAFSVSDGRAAFRAIMTAAVPGTRPSAVICGNDILAFGAMFEASAMGLRVPGDVSVCGFDDIELAAHVPPGLTTMRVPSAEMGRVAASQLVGFLERKPVHKNLRLKVELIVRGSSAPPPKI